MDPSIVIQLPQVSCVAELLKGGLKIEQLVRLRALGTAILGLFLAVLSGACGSDPAGSDGDGNGQALVLIHDAPIHDLKEVWLTVSSVRLIGADSLSNGEALLAEPLRIDFLSLDSVSRVLTLAEVEGQTFSKIRLEVSNPEFVDTNDVVIDASQIQLVANGKVDLNFQGPITIPPGAFTIISVDLDLENSIQVNQTGNGKYILHPQFKLDPATTAAIEIEIDSATIISIDADSLGSTLVAETPGSAIPVTIGINASTEIQSLAGDPLEIAALVPGTSFRMEGYIDVNAGEIVATVITVL